MSATAYVAVRYIAECVPCRWMENAEDYDDATLAAEEHDENRHPEATA